MLLRPNSVYVSVYVAEDFDMMSTK